MLRDEKSNLTRSRRIMIIRRIASVTVILFALAMPLFLAAGVAGSVPAGAQAVPSGPGLGFGAWAFNGKDKAGVIWTGTLVIEKLDTSQFDPQKYIAAAAAGTDREGTCGGHVPNSLEFCTCPRFDVPDLID